MEELKVGDIIKNRYALIRFLGSGSFGEVWLAHDQMTGRNVALKIYLSLDPDGVDVFQREYSNTIDISSSYLLTPDHFDVYGRRPFLVMKYCENGSASKLVGNISEEQLWNFISDVANGLAVLHGQSDPIVHQDIKPDNILIEGNGRFLITDFGISKRLRATMRRQSKRDVSSGSMPYMAPERFESIPTLTPASDIWSLGASIYELVSGDLPLQGFGGSMLKHGAEVPSLGSYVSSSLNNLMMVCLSKDPKDRPTAKDLVEAAARKSFRPCLQKNERISSKQTSVKNTKQESKSNSSRGSLIRISVIALIALIGYLIKIPTQNKITELKNNSNTESLTVKDSVEILTPTSVPEIVLDDTKTTIKERIVPKPKKVDGPNDLPFNPAGCPYIYIQGCNKNDMLNHISKKFNIYGRDYVVTMGDGRPNGTIVKIACNNYAQNLVYDIHEFHSDPYDIFDEDGFLNEEWNMQITFMDVDNDDECELLFTVQSDEHSWGCYTLIYKLYPHPYHDTIVKYIGEITAYNKMFLDGTKIVAPHFREGLQQEYMLDPNGKLICITDY